MGFKHKLRDLRGEIEWRLEMYQLMKDWRMNCSVHGCTDIDVIMQADVYRDCLVFNEFGFSKRPLALFEMKFYRVSEADKQKVIDEDCSNRQLADMAGLPFFMTVYYPADALWNWHFKVYAVNDAAKTILGSSFELLTEREYFILLKRIHKQTVDSRMLHKFADTTNK